MKRLRIHAWNKEQNGALCGVKIKWVAQLIGVVACKLTCKLCKKHPDKFLYRPSNQKESHEKRKMADRIV